MRLTQSTRSQILRSVLDDAFGKRRDRLAKRESALALRVRDSLLGKHKAVYLALPPNLLPKSNDIDVNAGGLRVSLCFEHATPCPPISWRHPVPLETGTRLAEAVIKLTDAKKQIKDDEGELSAKIGAALYSVTTYKKLVEEWPAVEKYLPADAPKQLPAIRVGELDKEIAAAKKDA